MVARFVERVVPDARVERADRPGLEGRSLSHVLQADVVVATEAALAEIDRPRISTAVALSVDSFLHRPSHTAGEEAFQILWSLSGLVAGPRRAGRVIVETSTPDNHVIQAVVRGNYNYFAEHELKEREATESPPFRSLVRLRSSRFSEQLLSEIGSLPETDLLGPADGARGSELLLKVRDLEAILDPLRRMVIDAQQRTSVEVDPRDF